MPKGHWEVYDDLTDEVIPDEIYEGPVRFGLDEWDYKIDLHPDEAKALRAYFQPFIARATRIPSADENSKAADKHFRRMARAWAIDNGIPVSPHGCCSNAILALYKETLKTKQK